MSISIASRKAKGKDLQNLVAKKISELLGIPIEPDGEIVSRQSSQHGVDIVLSPRVRKLFPFSIEAKNQQQLNLPKTWKQASDNCYEGTHPLIVYKKTGKLKSDRVPPVVIVELDLFFDILEKYLKE
jgi:hypothetical protein